MRPLVIQTERLHDESAAWLAERCTLVRAAPGEPAFEESIISAQALIVRTYTRVDTALLERAPALRVVGRAGVGLDNIDVAACRVRGIEVVYTPDANTTAVVEYVFALLFDALRPRVHLQEAVTQTRWAELRRELSAPRQLADLTLGVYGFGRVGSSVARAGAAFAMRVLYHDLLDIPETARFGATPVTREILLAECDVVTVHVDGRASNRKLLNADAFARMKPDVVFVNTSRGFIVDAEALSVWLTAHPDAQALLDVHEQEPFGEDYPLLGLANAQLSPHIAAATVTADKRMSRVVHEVWRVLEKG
jgi:phosphoglycerate dehydrogenase-like enzyme